MLDDAGRKSHTPDCDVANIVRILLTLKILSRKVSENVPKPRRYTFSPCARLSFTTTINCSTTARTLALSIPVVFAISFTISALVILRTYLI